MPSPPASRIITRLLIFACVIFASTTAAEAPEWLKSITPKKGDTLQSEIQCYALPYGTIGFVSHLLTYYTIFMITIGHSPMLPWHELSAPHLDIFLGAVGLLVGFILTIFTMVRCHQRWEFLLIAMWKSSLSITLGTLSVHADLILRRDLLVDIDQMIEEAIWWLIIYGVGTIIGLAGLGRLVVKSWGDKVVVLATKVFSGVAIVAIVFTWGVAVGQHGLLAALYSDWVLAGLAGNLIGMPSSDNSVLYFAYFSAKRLPFFSF
ncbi:hypothetical protein BDD12DRAFT_887999 [Trichophaea hybrida]|nr:hypothetical protein BDD12DRAFT_887999 [Trichophaea hybrida]